MRSGSTSSTPSTTGMRFVPGSGWTSVNDPWSTLAVIASSIPAADNRVGTMSMWEVGASLINIPVVALVPIRAIENGTRVASS